MTAQRPPYKRPIWVWLISIFYFGFGASGIMAVGMALMLLSRGSVPPSELSALKTLLQSSLWGILPAASMAAAASLFFMRRLAFPLFVFLLITRLSMPIVFGSAYPAPGFSAGDAEMITGYAVGYGILLIVCLYVFRLRQRGMLR